MGQNQKGIEKILISACLLERRVRYDGKSLPIFGKIIDQWRSEGRIVAVCPEVEAGMSTPRVPAEISKGNGLDVIDGGALVLDRNGKNVTEYFINGAEIALSLCKKHEIKIAILAESSPSCGSSNIYDGGFVGKKKAGVGVTAALLRKNGIKVFSQFSLSAANKELHRTSH